VAQRQWQPNLFRNTTAIYPFEGDPSRNLETAMADEAIQHITELKALAPDSPWFVYYVPGATHAPLIRRRSFEEKKLFIKQADIYGAYLAYADHEIGRVIHSVEDLGELDNTLIIYIGGDNGASAEGMVNGTPNEFTTFNGIPVPVKDQFLWYPFWGSERTFPHFAAGWAWAVDTPFKWVKQVPSHFGGTSQGVAMSWPGHITDVGGIRRQFQHVIDIVQTILEATGIQVPETINGITQRPIEGVSMAYTREKANVSAPTRHTTQYFEMLGNRAIYHDGWWRRRRPRHCRGN